MGDTLAKGPCCTPWSHGRCGSLVRTNRRIEYGTSPMAIRGFGGEKGAKRRELECLRMGWHGSQNCSLDSRDEVEDSHPLLMVTSCLNSRLLAGVMERRRNCRKFPKDISLQGLMMCKGGSRHMVWCVDMMMMVSSATRAIVRNWKGVETKINKLDVISDIASLGKDYIKHFLCFPREDLYDFMRALWNIQIAEPIPLARYTYFNLHGPKLKLTISSKNKCQQLSFEIDRTNLPTLNSSSLHYSQQGNIGCLDRLRRFLCYLEDFNHIFEDLKTTFNPKTNPMVYTLWSYHIYIFFFCGNTT